MYQPMRTNKFFAEQKRGCVNPIFAQINFHMINYFYSITCRVLLFMYIMCYIYVHNIVPYSAGSSLPLLLSVLPQLQSPLLQLPTSMLCFHSVMTGMCSMTHTLIPRFHLKREDSLQIYVCLLTTN